MRTLIVILLLGFVYFPARSIAAPLHDAARAGDINKVRQLANGGADVNAVDSYGFSPLLLAQLNDHPQTARFLTSKGARDQLQPLVKQLQYYLNELGHDTGGTDGLLGPGTRSAIRAFQKQENLEVTGRVYETWVHRLHNRMLSKVQRDLKTLGFYGGDIDGMIGPATRDAIRAFQQQADLPITAGLQASWIQAVQNALQRSTSTAQQAFYPSTRTGSENSQNAAQVVQEKLLALGYAPGEPDGLVGPGTTKAIRDFQTRHKLTITGQAEGAWLAVLDRELLRAIQKELAQQGYSPGPADGEMGSQTEQAIRQFQKSQGLAVDGKPSVSLLGALQNPLPEVSNTDNAKTISQLQTTLSALGYDTKGVDGHLGPATQSAIRDFERQHNLPVSGKLSEPLSSRLQQELVKQTQIQLSALGYQPGTADGLLGEDTKKAIHAFQKSQKLSATGQASVGLLAALKSAIIQQKSNDAKQAQAQRAQVEKIQRRLQALGYNIGQIDGELGPATESAIKTFQERQNLGNDGKATDQLLAVLDQALAEQAKARTKPETSEAKTEPQKIEASTDVALINEPTPSRQLIAEIQSRLNGLGYDAGAPDGKVGPRTERAIRAYQSQVGFAVDGEASQNLLTSLKSTPVKLARAPAASKIATQTGKNTEVRGRLLLQRANNGTLVGCSIKGVQLELSWCQPFIARKNTRNCKAIIRPNSKVLLVKCG